MFGKVKLLFQALRVKSEWEKAAKEGTLKPALNTLWHTLLLAAPAIGGFAAKAIADALVSSHTPLLVAIGTLVGTVFPWLSNPPASSPAAPPQQ